MIRAKNRGKMSSGANDWKQIFFKVQLKTIWSQKLAAGKNNGILWNTENITAGNAVVQQ